MSASLWSDDEDERTGIDVLESKQQTKSNTLFQTDDPLDKYSDLFGSSGSGHASKKANLFASPSSSKKKSHIECLFGENDKDDSDDNSSLFGKSAGEGASAGNERKAKVTHNPRSLDKLDVFADDEDDEDDEDGNYSLYGKVDLSRNGAKEEGYYKSLYEKEVAKCTQLELKVESLLDKISLLEEKLRGATKSVGATHEDEAQLKSMKEVSRQLRQKNRQKLLASRQKAKTSSGTDMKPNKDNQTVVEGNINCSDLLDEASPRNEDGVMNSHINDGGDLPFAKLHISNPKISTSNSLFDSDSSDSSDSDSDANTNAARILGGGVDDNMGPSLTSTLSVNEAVEKLVAVTKDGSNKNSVVSDRQKQILARQQARSRGAAAAKLKTDKSNTKSTADTDSVIRTAIAGGSSSSSSNAAHTVASVRATLGRRGSAGGLKYDGGGWQSSSDEEEEEEDEEEEEQEDAGNDKSSVATSSTAAVTSTVGVSERSVEEDFDRQVDFEVCAWCAKQQNLITMIQTLPEIYTNQNLSPENFQVSYSSSPNEVRKAYLKIARYCHPDKQKRLVNAGQTRRDHLIAEKLFSALADAYNAYKIQFDL